MTTVRHTDFPSHSDYSPYEGQALRGAVTHTILRGRVIAAGGALSAGLGSAAGGTYLYRAN